MKKITFYSLLLPALLIAGIASGQTDPLKTLAGKLENIHKDLPLEKVHLQFDKPYYTIGDTIWFKAYVVNADQNEFSALSSILYVDLINSSNVVKRSLRLPMTVGSAHGDIVLADSLTEGNYRVRAYTNWMRNFGDDYFFDKTFVIGNALSNKIVTKSNFTFTNTGDRETVTADINYSLLGGQPVASKEVSYNVELNDRNIAKGKVTTDAQGNLKITFGNNKDQPLTSGMITTVLKGDDNKDITKVIPIKATSDNITVQFFPESGQMVNGISSRIAFKALRADGLGAEVSGYIADKDNNKIADFKTEHAGMGVVAMVPQAGNSYKAVVKLSDGTEKNYPLPKAELKGYVLSLDNSNKDNLRVRISVSPETLKEGADIILIAQSNNNIHYTAKTKLQSTILSTSIAKSRFPEGIIQFTLFTGNNVPVAERIVFIDHPDAQLAIKANADQQTYKARQKVKTDIDIGNITGGSLSVAITDMGKVPADEDAETTIFSSLLLSSDLKGYIEKPNYYFTNSSDAKVMQLDNLMMTQGWRKFQWKEILNDVVPKPQFSAEKGISISGKMIATGSKKPYSKAGVTLLGAGLPIDTLTDQEGHFSFDNLVFADSARFIVHTKNAKERNNATIELDQNPKLFVSKNKNDADAAQNAGSSMITYLKSSSGQFDELEKNGLLKKTVIQLQEVQVNAQKTVQGKEVVANSSNIGLPGHYDYLIKSKDMEIYSNLATAVQGKVPGITVTENPTTHEWTAHLARNMSMATGGFIPMAIYIDGVDRGTDIGPLAVNPADIASVEVLTTGGNTAIYGTNSAGGVIVVTTKRGSPGTAGPIAPAPGTQSVRPKGYSIGREFYSPSYADPKKTNRMADLRTTIYWNPEVIPGKDGKTSFEFYSADTPGTYRAVIEGLDYSGKLGRQVVLYTIK